jgi:hypothetical protein
MSLEADSVDEARNLALEMWEDVPVNLNNPTIVSVEKY